MGGPGSGEWEREHRKTTVEECYTLNMQELLQDNKLHGGASGKYTWDHDDDERPFIVLSQTMQGDSPDQFALILQYRIHDDEDNGAGEDVFLPIVLQPTYPHLGGRRWWFTCPLAIDGVSCKRRAAKLYLPPYGRYFGCLHCHDLTYQSCQRAHYWQRLWSPTRLAKREKRLKKLMAKHGW